MNFTERHRRGDHEIIKVYLGRGGEPKATRLAIEHCLRLGESVELAVRQVDKRPGPPGGEIWWWEFRVIPPTILTLAEIRSGTGFPRGTRFVQLPDPKVGKAS